MTRDELRGLIGGYATGSLSEAERKILFEAALEDQELFDELAGEQALKAALEEPGAKQRLIVGLESKVRSPKAGSAKLWWKTGWAWGAAAAAAVVVIAGIVLVHSTARVEEVARLEVPQQTAPPAPEVAAPVAPPSTALPPKTAAPKVTREAAPPQTEARDSVRAAEPAAISPAPLRPPAPEAKKEAVEPPQQAASAARAPANNAYQIEAGRLAAPRPQAFAQGDVAVGTGAGAAGGVAGALTAPSASPPPPPPAAGGRGGVGGGGGGARALAQMAPLAQAPAAKTTRFAFDYSVTPELVLRVLPYANGFLTVAVTKAGSTERIVDRMPLQAGMQTEVRLPDGSESVMVLFSAQATGGFGGGIGATDPLSGTKTDPNPTANSILTALIRLPR